MGSFSIWHWLIPVSYAVKDLGSALRDFKKSLYEDENQSSLEDSKKQ